MTSIDAYPEDELLAYTAVLAKFALCTDDELTEEETVFMLALIEELPVSLESKKKFCDFLDADTMEIKQERVEPFVATLRGSLLRFPFIADLLLLAYADGVYDDGEAALVSDMCKGLGVSSSQYDAIADYMQKVTKLVLPSNDADALPADDDLLEATGCQKAFAAAGVPEAAFEFFRTGLTPASYVTKQACERVQAELVQCGWKAEEDTEADRSRSLRHRSFSSYFYNSMVRSTKRNFFASALHKITGTRRPHSWINMFYWLTGRRRMRYSRRPSGALHFAGMVAGLSGH